MPRDGQRLSLITPLFGVLLCIVTLAVDGSADAPPSSETPSESQARPAPETRADANASSVPAMGVDTNEPSAPATRVHTNAPSAPATRVDTNEPSAPEMRAAKNASQASEMRADATSPNILVFIADDAGWEDFGAYGNEGIRTPNIDRLAAEGLKVERAFLTTAQCSPSRISILTGRYPHATGAEDLHMPLPESDRIVPGYLGDRGYFTGHMQKTHYGPHADAQFDWYDAQLSERFPAFLDAAGDQPFFLWVGFSDPHRPYEEGILEEPHDPADVTVPPYLADTPETRADLAQYYDEISRMDGHIGRMIEELERRGLRDSTLVVFLTDNGAPFPRAKGTVYDAGVRTPLLFSWPAEIEAGSSYQGLVSVIDLAPTWLDLAGIEKPARMQGESIRSIFTDQTTPGREYVFSERNWHDCDEHIRSVRTEHFKLIRNAYVELPHGTPADIGGSPSFRTLKRLQEEGKLTPAQARLFEAPRPRIELYDLEKDPYELRNVAADDDYWERARELAAVLDGWIDETGDFPPWTRVRDDHTDRITGVWFSTQIPPMREVRE